ncbi:MAG: TonB-dependent receptor [Bacteroidota bacterium]
MDLKLRAGYIYFLLALLIGVQNESKAQDFRQQVRGKVFDELTKRSLDGAEVILFQQENKFTSQTDETGKFKFDQVPIGRYMLKVSLEGYADYQIPDILIGAGKEVNLEIPMSFVSYNSDEVEIAQYNSRKYNFSGVSTRIFTVEESQRFAATYYDPARLAANYPGIAVTSDESNNLVIRGNSPNGVLWRLEGVDIVNPNHTPNAGTFTDRLTQSGGGTIILSNQLLTDSRIQTSAFDPQYGNALAGVFDMRLRKGNNEKHEFVFQPSLIGLDLSAEGPLGKNGGSYLTNYRYSTIGLFDLIGLEVSPERINYQDLAFNISLPTEKAGTFTLFGMGGRSSNRFEAPREDSLIEENRDRFDVDFFSNMGAIGLTHQLNIGENTLWKSVLAASAIRSDREENFLRTFTQIDPSTFDEIKQEKISFTSSFSHRINSTLNLEEGFFLTRLGYRMTSEQFSLENPGSAAQILARAEGTSLLFQPYVAAIYSPNSRLRLNAGFHGVYFGLNGRTAVEPRLNIEYQLSPKSRITGAYGLHSQLQLYGTYFTEFEGRSPNRELDFTKAHHGVLRFLQSFSGGLSLNVETYYQALFNVPISQDPTSNFSALNLFEGYITDSLVNEGSGRNYGVEVSLDQDLNNGFYYLVSGSLYESKYTGADGIERDSRFNGNYLFNAAAGKEFERVTSKGKSKTFGINLSLTYQGGFRNSPVDLAASQAAQRTVFDLSSPFSEKFPDFFRTDLRLVFKRNKNGFTRTFALDILNLTNRSNVAFRRYDLVSNSVVDKTSFGVLPLLSYRMEF